MNGERTFRAECVSGERGVRGVKGMKIGEGSAFAWAVLGEPRHSKSWGGRRRVVGLSEDGQGRAELSAESAFPR